VRAGDFHANGSTPINRDLLIKQEATGLDDHAIEQHLVRPADAVERACFPGRAAKLDKLIVEWRNPRTFVLSYPLL
jgi:hypothetical protein